VKTLGFLGLLGLLALRADAAPNPGFAKSGITDWTTPPPAVTERVFTPPVAKRLKLANGIQLLVIENHTLPIASLALLVPGAGSASDVRGKAGLAAFTADLLDEGAGDLDALAFASEQDRLGASIYVGVDADGAVVGASTLSRTLEPTLALITKLVTQPRLDDKEAERVKGDRLTSLALRRDRPREVASNVLLGALYGAASPYGHPVAGTRPEVTSLTAADARTFYAERWAPAGMTLVIAGDVDPAALQRSLDATLGAWRSPRAKPAAKLAAAPKAARRVLLVDRPGAAQSDVRIGLVGPERKDPRYFAFEVLRTTFGDGFTSRLIHRLREELGIIYNGGAAMEWRVKPGPFVISVAIQTPDTARGIQEILRMVTELTTTDVPPAELEKSKQNLIRALPALFGSNSSTVSAFAELVEHGLPDTYYATYADAVRKVTATDVKASARALIAPERLVVSLVGDLAKTRAALDALELGPVTLFDPFGEPAR
jgi:zinc protease